MFPITKFAKPKASEIYSILSSMGNGAWVKVVAGCQKHILSTYRLQPSFWNLDFFHETHVSIWQLLGFSWS